MTVRTFLPEDDQMQMIVYVVRWVCRPCSHETGMIIDAVWKFYGPKYQRFLGNAMRSERRIPCYLCAENMWRTSWQMEEEELGDVG